MSFISVHECVSSCQEYYRVLTLKVVNRFRCDGIFMLYEVCVRKGHNILLFLINFRKKLRIMLKTCAAYSPKLWCNHAKFLLKNMVTWWLLFLLSLLIPMRSVLQLKPAMDLNPNMLFWLVSNHFEAAGKPNEVYYSVLIQDLPHLIAWFIHSAPWHIHHVCSCWLANSIWYYEMYPC